MTANSDLDRAAVEYPRDESRQKSDLRSPQFADDALAQKFTALHSGDLRYTAARRQWSIWSDSTWKPDETLAVFDLVRAVCRRESAACKGDEWLKTKIASANTVAAVERLARADRRHAATIEQWDADPWLLNTPGGIIDLRTGNLRPARREDYQTKSTSVAPGKGCSAWLQFLERITSGDQELQRFLQRMCGYSLTGVTREHALFFLYGTGANGKSVFVNTLCGLLDSYAKTAPIETFIDSKSQNHPTDLAGLQGARLVTAVETEDGRRWAESKLKALTGGDRIAARYMRQDFFEFSPVFKLLIAGNHKPGLRTADEAMRRRFNLLPFTVTIPPSERDAELTEKLRGEWAGILQWAIDGCLTWQREGLNPPASVIDATAEYFESEDSIGQWIRERCAEGANLKENTAILFADFKAWAERYGAFVGSQRGFSDNLEARGYERDRNKIARGFRGIALRRVSGDAGDANDPYPRQARGRERSIKETASSMSPQPEEAGFLQ